MCAKQSKFSQVRCRNSDQRWLWGIGFALIAAGWYLRPATRLPAGDRVTNPFDGVRYVHRVVDVPRRIDMSIVLIDLKNPHIRFEVTGDRGDGNGNTNRETTSRFVRRLGAQIGINGGFFNDRGNLISLSASNGQRVASAWSLVSRERRTRWPSC